MAFKKPNRSTVYRGAEGFAKAEQELKKQKQKAEQRKNQAHMPFRFRVAVGETTQFVVVDDEPTFFRYEHNMKDPATQRWDIFTGCVKEIDNCPVCEAAGKESYYAMYLTVIDFSPFTTKDGVEHEFSRKLLVVKAGQQKKFQRVLAKAEGKGRTLRGALFETARDGDRDSSIGNDIEFLEYLEEDELEEYVRTWKDKEGKKHTEVCHEPLDYDALFPEQSVEELRELVGAEPPPGSRAHERKELGTSRRTSRGKKEEDDEEDEDWEKPERTQRMRKGRTKDEEDDEAEEKVPRRRVGKAKPAPVDDDEDDTEDEEDEPVKPSRRGASRRAVKKEPAYDDEDDEDDEAEDDEPPARAPRRVSMRKGRK